MSRRRLSRQQKQRIEAAQSADLKSLPQGLVVSHRGGRILVETEQRESVECKIKSNLGSIVCGDRVAIERSANGEHRVMATLPRDNLLQRVDGFGKVRAVAANISQLVVCLAIKPEPNRLMLDQYLLCAEQQQINAVILVNKIDLADNPEMPVDFADTYRAIGYEVIYTSTVSGLGMDSFRQSLADERTVLSGASGVGKSSLTAWLLPDENIKIADISEANEEGRHTTRTSTLYHLQSGGDLIDTPGVRGFNPYIDASSPLDHGFREIYQHAKHCRFHNCRHMGEPGCAVVDAIEAGLIDALRFDNYRKLLQQQSDV